MRHDDVSQTDLASDLASGPRSVTVACCCEGGTYFPMTNKKGLRAQEIAMQNRCGSERAARRAAVGMRERERRHG